MTAMHAGFADADADADAGTDPVWPRPPERSWVVEVHAVGGPDAGRIWSLGPGSHDIGAASAGAVEIAGPRVPDRAAVLTVTPSGQAWLTPGGELYQGTDSIWLNPVRAPQARVRPVTGELPWPAGSDLVVGDVVLRLAQPTGATGATGAQSGGEAEVRRAMLQEWSARCASLPDAAQTALSAVRRGSTLWERRRGDADWLTLRVGSADQASTTEVVDPALDPSAPGLHWTLPDVPVPLALAGVGSPVITGGDHRMTRALAYWLVVQSAVRHDPADLRIRLLADIESCASWKWVGWLPHARSAAGPATAEAVVDADPGSVAERIAGLTAELRRRAVPGARPASEPSILVILDDVSRLCVVPEVRQLLAEGPALGIHAVCVDAVGAPLPPECAVVVHCDATSMKLTLTGPGPTIAGIRPDLVGLRWCEHLARALALRGENRLTA